MAMISELVQETIMGIFYGIFLWAARRSSTSSASSKRKCDGGDDGSGLIVALRSEGENARNATKRIVHSCMATKAKPLPPTSFFSWRPSETSSSWTSSTSGDILGTESGVHMARSEDAAPWENPKPSTCRQSRRVKMEAEKWDVPPPITLLQGRGDYTGPLPWFLTREYVNGRLILREATVERFEYLETTRTDGRLQINLVEVDNTANCCQFNTTEEEENGENSDEKEEADYVHAKTVAEINDEDDDHEDALLVLDEMNQCRMPMSFAASLPETTVKNVLMNIHRIRKCQTYAEGFGSKNLLDRHISQPSTPELF